jgi:hypothetical protein
VCDSSEEQAASSTVAATAASERVPLPDAIIRLLNHSGTPQCSHTSYRTTLGYWQSYGFGELSETARTRHDAPARLLPQLKIAGRVEPRACAAVRSAYGQQPTRRLLSAMSSIHTSKPAGDGFAW